MLDFFRGYTVIVSFCALLVWAMLLQSCAALPFLAKAAQGAQWIATALDVAESGASAYYAKHPSEKEREVFDALYTARQAVELYDRMVATGSSKDIADARNHALDAYDKLYQLLKTSGVMAAKPPLGGPETDAPLPKPIKIPTAEELAIGQE